MFGLRQRRARSLPRKLGRLINGLTRPVHAGPEPRRSNPDAVVDCAVYHGGTRRPGQAHYTHAARLAQRQKDAYVWLGLHEPDEPTMAAIARVFDLHELTAEQATAGGHRPAAETIGEVTRLVLRTARYVEH